MICSSWYGTTPQDKQVVEGLRGKKTEGGGSSVSKI